MKIGRSKKWTKHRVSWNWIIFEEQTSGVIRIDRSLRVNQTVEFFDFKCVFWIFFTEKCNFLSIFESESFSENFCLVIRAVIVRDLYVNWYWMYSNKNRLRIKHINVMSKTQTYIVFIYNYSISIHRKISKKWEIFTLRHKCTRQEVL